ncbi:MAG: 2-C-methyl-D-erythritol 2,4-cyclodiphosphate synthase [Chloroflexi bacterium]|nr:2-C-methyl-D-erythritol 2,4-cyclodiphosphate synthase [Chloroflexota bacterium]
MRVGIGYDVHRLVQARRLVLGGVTVPSELGMAGHSDADVLVHALMDSLLGAAGLPDIGVHFPPGDPKYTEASSINLLENVRGMLRQEGYTIVNVDATLVAERPKVSPYIAMMKKRLSEAMDIPEAAIGIKATTNEGIGFVGRGEGIAAIAVALIDRVPPPPNTEKQK